MLKKPFKTLWESDDSNNGKDGIDDGDDHFKELVHKLNKE